MMGKANTMARDMTTRQQISKCDSKQAKISSIK
jgi:hypothetical protein